MQKRGAAEAGPVRTLLRAGAGEPRAVRVPLRHIEGREPLQRRKNRQANRELRKDRPSQLQVWK